MLTLLLLIACEQPETPACMSGAMCEVRADAAAAAGDRVGEFVALSHGCDLGNEPLCMRLVEQRYLNADSRYFDPAMGRSMYRQSCERKYFQACTALGDSLAASDDVINAEMWYHKGCELGNVPLCMRSAAYAVDVQKREVGLTALPDAVHACQQGDAPSCHAAVTIAGGVGPPAGQDLDGFTKSMLQAACLAGEATSCVEPPPR